MNRASHPAIREPHDRTGRLHHWTAVLATALFHLLLVLRVLQTPPISMTTPQGSPNGSAMEVTLFDEAQPLPPEPVPPVRKRVPHSKPAPPHAVRRRPPTPIVQATVPAPEAPDTSTGPPAPASSPPSARDDTAGIDFPGYARRNDNARANAALAAKLRGGGGGRSTTPAPAGPSMGVDGFHVYYTLANEARLRTWRDQGMTELFLPLPGTRRLMVCPLEVALHRGSGACRMVDMDSPELTTIGDARDVIDIQQVYQLGNLVWRGPGPYR